MKRRIPRKLKKELKKQFNSGWTKGDGWLMNNGESSYNFQTPSYIYEYYINGQQVFFKPGDVMLFN